MRTRIGKTWIGILSFAAVLPGAVVLDRIAAVAGAHVIKLSDVERDIRLTDFLNRTPLDLHAQAKHDAAERLITQQIIRDEIASGSYRRPQESEATALEADLARDRFGGSSERLREALKRYDLTDAELHDQLLWQITVLQFINQRFRGGIVVTDEEVRDYYDEHWAEMRKQYPKDNSLEALEPKIRGMLEGQRINQAFNEWLDQARKNLKVDFKAGALD